jgi:hypothetical protein
MRHEQSLGINWLQLFLHTGSIYKRK